MAILGISHILRKISTYHFINLKCIFQKLIGNETKGESLILAHGQLYHVTRCEDNNSIQFNPFIKMLDNS
jgi:hypothetical protein